MPRVRPAVTLALLASVAACAPRPLHVGLLFRTGWTFGGERFSDTERALVESRALEVLRRAFEAFAVTVDTDPRADRIVVVEDTPFASYRRGNIVVPGAVGVTLALGATSSVRIDALYVAELSALRCRTFGACGARTREELLNGLGTGVGATAAHELGHQAGLRFSGDARCESCYDGESARSALRFFGTKRWSEDAAARMRRVLRGS